MLIPRMRRESRYLFDYSPKFCLERNIDQAISGHPATSTRTSIGSTIGSDGMLHVAAHSQPRYTWLDLDSDGVKETACRLLEDARTNVVLWNRDLTNAAWTKTNATPAKDQVGIDGVAASASSLLATAGNATCLQAITLASSARYQTAYVKRLAGSGVIQMTTDNGSTWTAITVTSSWTRVSIPTQTLANPTVGFRVVTNGDKIAVDFVQNENGIFETSAIPTTNASVPRAADGLSFTLNLLPQVMTVYVDAVWRVAANAATNYVAWSIGSPSAPYIVGRLSGSTLNPETQHNNGSGPQTSSSALAPTFNQRAETRHVLRADGSTITGVSINSGVESVGAAAAAAALAAAWNAATLRIGSDTSQLGFFALRAIRIAAGEQSLVFMREG
ncbi:MAG TPA: hypothetical protein VIP11_12000 [Gemmatimonadaceae bacterium]